MAFPTLSLQPIVFGKQYNLTEHTDLILQRLRDLNIKAIEGGHKDPAVMKAKLEQYGMQYSATHFALSGKPDVAQTIQYLKVVGGKDVCNSGITVWHNFKAQDFTDSISQLNGIGKRLHNEGIAFHYHNHAFEFEKLDNDSTGMQMLFDGLDPKYVDFCIDVAWVQRGGDDPAAFLKKHASRIGYVHIKDTVDKDDPEAAGWRPLGKGVLNWPPIIEAIKALPACRWAAIEQDKAAGDPWEAITTSRKFLKEQFGL